MPLQRGQIESREVIELHCFWIAQQRYKTRRAPIVSRDLDEMPFTLPVGKLDHA